MSDSPSQRYASDEPALHAGKRRRIALACNICRTRKSRCDGARPKCSLCVDMGFDCVYQQSSSYSNIIVGKEYLSSLEDRVQNLEETLGRFQSKFDALNAHISRNSSRPLPQQARTTIVPEENSEELHDGSASATDENEVDAMASVVFANEEETGFFGPSSNIAFLRHITRAIAQASQADQDQSRASITAPRSARIEGGFMSISRPSSPTVPRNQEEETNLFVLPPEAVCLRLIEEYFAVTGFLYPFMHEPSFRRTYALMKDKNPTGIRKTWLGLLNMVLALGNSTSVSGSRGAEKRIAESDVYYERALGLCQKQILRGSSLEILQYLLMMGLYLQGTQKSVQAWTIHGLAVKAAYQLGLHSDCNFQNCDPLQKELRRRAWYVCVVLDRSLSMTTGRPSSISDTYVNLPLPQPFSTFESTRETTPVPRLDSTTFFNRTM